MISVILPVYNEAEYIGHFLESLARQSISDWEVVVVDDGSTDNTIDIVAAWSRNDSRIRVIDPKTKLGKVEAFNRAFAASSGDFICHIGGDDVLPRRGLEHRVHSLLRSPARAVSFGKLQFIDSAGTVTGKPIPRGAFGSQSSPGATYTRPLADLIFPIPSSLPSEDIWLGNAARACSETTYHINKTITLYRRHSLNSNPRHQSFDKMNQAISERMDAYNLLLASELPIPPEFRTEFLRRIQTETFRSNGMTRPILTQAGTTIVDRLANASMSNPHLWRLRQTLGAAASGWRGR